MLQLPCSRLHYSTVAFGHGAKRTNQVCLGGKETEAVRESQCVQGDIEEDIPFKGHLEAEPLLEKPRIGHEVPPVGTARLLREHV